MYSLLLVKVCVIVTTVTGAAVDATGEIATAAVAVVVDAVVARTADEVMLVVIADVIVPTVV
jgi:hypothetical protein